MGNSLNPFKKQTCSFAYQPLLNPQISESKNLRVFSFKRLEKATKKFQQGRVVTEDDGTVRTFYKGYINETSFAPSRTKTGIAVSVMKCLIDQSKTIQEWMAKVKTLWENSHPNLVKILGYCSEDKESHFLVFEYLHKGSLDRHILGKEEEEVLPWEIRVKIAIGTAQGLAFIHSVKNSTMHLELRMHNIMLDEEYNAKLFNIETNQQCSEDEVIRFKGGFGYLAPEIAITGHCVTETDVYTFGVILLELLTGLKAFDTEREKRNLVVWRVSFSYNKGKIREIIDPRLGNDYPVNAVTRMASFIRRCIEGDKKKRPLMQQVLDRLSDIAKIKD